MAARKRSKRSVLVLGVAQRGNRRGVLKTNITPSDHSRLHAILLSKPELVLATFADLQIECLAQIDGWDDLRLSHPEATAAVIFVAATMGIPETFAIEAPAETGPETALAKQPEPEKAGNPETEGTDYVADHAAGDGAGIVEQRQSGGVSSVGEDPLRGVSGEGTPSGQLVPL